MNPDTLPLYHRVPDVVQFIMDAQRELDWNGKAQYRAYNLERWQKQALEVMANSKKSYYLRKYRTGKWILGIR